MEDIPWFDSIIKKNCLDLIDNRWVCHSIDKNASSWSFSTEWKEHAATSQEKTWDMTAAERLLHFYSETKMSPEQLPNKLVLDAGCGNGQLTIAIGNTGAHAIGIDRQPHMPAGTSNTQFIQCDFDNPPFTPQIFDIIIANGSIHHTKSTFSSFQSLTKLVKEDGRLYVWVYKKQKGWKGFLVGCLDLVRYFMSRFPNQLQRFSVNALTFFFYILSRIRKGENSHRTKAEIRINIYDAFTPKYRSYHTKEEIQDWFTDSGFKEVAVTHDNNKYGFGMLGIRSTR